MDLILLQTLAYVIRDSCENRRSISSKSYIFPPRSRSHIKSTKNQINNGHNWWRIGLSWTLKTSHFISKWTKFVKKLSAFIFMAIKKSFQCTSKWTNFVKLSAFIFMAWKSFLGHPPLWKPASSFVYYSYILTWKQEFSSEIALELLTTFIYCVRLTCTSICSR